MADHELIYGESFVTDDMTASCTCGWRVDARNRTDAIDKWENHCDVVFMEATERVDDI